MLPAMTRRLEKISRLMSLMFTPDQPGTELERKYQSMEASELRSFMASIPC